MSDEPLMRAARADAARNRANLLDAAKTVFASGVTSVGLEEVARCASLGVGTLYRHFPTRDALYEAVYRREVDKLSAVAQRLPDGQSPELALCQWVDALIEFVATKKGMATALALAASNKSLSTYSFEKLTGAAALLLASLSSSNSRARKSPLKIFCGR